MVVIIPPPAADIIFFIHACVDPSGMKLRKLFSVCDFMMNDNGDGCVTMDEAVQVAVLLLLVIQRSV